MERQETALCCLVTPFLSPQAKHIEVCKKVTTKKRSTFDSRQQRQLAEGENDPSLKRPFSSSRNSTSLSSAKAVNSKVNASVNQANAPCKSSWREQHEEFIRTVREARAYKPKSKEAKTSRTNEESANKKSPSSRVSANDTSNGNLASGSSSVTATTVNGKRIPPGYVQCPTCERNFNRKAAERHIEWCAEKKAQSARTPTTKSEAMAKLKARTTYDPTKKRKSIPGTSNESPNGPSNLLMRSSISTLDLKARSPVMSNGTRRTQTKSSTSTLDLRSRPTHRSASPDFNLQRRRNTSHPTNGTHAESKVKALLESNRIRNAPKTPVVKFKEKFPPNDSSITTRYIGNHETLQELLRRPDTQNGSQMPKTVPGVRTGGMSPVKSIGGFENGDSNNATVKNGSSNNTSQTSGNIFSSNFDRMMRSLDDLMLGPAGSLFRDRNTRSSPSGSSGSDGRESSNGAGDVLTCHACGTKYPMSVAKYCFECGTRRLASVTSIS